MFNMKFFAPSCILGTFIILVLSASLNNRFGLWSWLVFNIYLFYLKPYRLAWSSDISGGNFPSDIYGRVLIDLHLNESWGHLFHLCSYNLFIEEVTIGLEMLCTTTICLMVASVQLLYRHHTALVEGGVHVAPI